MYICWYMTSSLSSLNMSFISPDPIRSFSIPERISPFQRLCTRHFCPPDVAHIVFHYISCEVSKPDELVSLATKPFQNFSWFQHQLVIFSNNSHNLMNWSHLFIIVSRYCQKYPELSPHGPQSRRCRPLAAGNFFSNFLPSTISTTINYITSGWNSIITCSLVPEMPKRFFSFFEKNTLPPSKDSIG